MIRTLATAALLVALLAPVATFAEDDAPAALSPASLAQGSLAQESLAQAPACLSRAEQRQAIAHGQAVTLATAVRSVRGTVRGRGVREVVNARLCREADGLRYVLTVLARDGKVTHTSVDATSGKVVDAR